jgi:hypothetical protein
MATLPDGIYRIALKLDHNACVDVEGGSQVSGANVQLYRNNGTNAQKWYLGTSPDGTRTLECLASGKMMDVSYGVAVSGRNIWQYERNSTRAQAWNILDKSGGHWAVQSALATNLMMDATGAQTADRTNIYIYTDNGTDAQRWAFFPTVYTANYPVPASVGLAPSVGGARSTFISIKGTQRLYPSWVGSAGTYQLRYRIRQRLLGTETWTGWGAWMSPTGVTTDDGWGNVQAATGSDNGSSTTRYHAAGISFSNTAAAYDRIETQVEVRHFEAGGYGGYGATVGASATGTITIAYRPTFSVSAVAFAPDGLRVDYACDYPKNGLALSLAIKTAAGVLVEMYEVKSLPYSGTLTIPFGSLKYIPADGASCTITGTYNTDGATYAISASGTIKYNAGHGTSVNASWATGDGYTEIVSLGSHTSTSAWLLIESSVGSRFVGCASAGGGKHTVVPPAGVPFKVFVVITDGTSWATAVLSRPKITAPLYYIWNYESGWTSLAIDTAITKSTDKDYKSYLPNGSDFEVVAFGQGSRRPVNLSGSAVPMEKVPHGEYVDFERLAAAKYATLRTPIGEWMRVAVLSVSDEMEWALYKTISVTMCEVA